MWIQDRSGGDVAFLDSNLNTFLAAAASARDRIGQHRIPRFGAPDLMPTSTATKYQTRHQPQQRLPDHAGIHGRGLRQSVQPLRPPMAGFIYKRRATSGRTPAISPATTSAREGRHGPALGRRLHRRVFGPEFTNRFNLYRAAHLIGTPAPGYSSDQGDAGAGAGRQRGPSPRDGLRVGRTSRTSSAKPAEPATGLRALVGLRLLILAALYESWSLPFSVLLSVPIAVFGPSPAALAKLRF